MAMASVDAPDRPMALREWLFCHSHLVQEQDLPNIRGLYPNHQAHPIDLGPLPKGSQQAAPPSSPSPAASACRTRGRQLRHPHHCTMPADLPMSGPLPLSSPDQL